MDQNALHVGVSTQLPNGAFVPTFGLTPRVAITLQQTEYQPNILQEWANLWQKI